MIKLLYLEFLKLKRSFIFVILLTAVLLPICLIVIKYLTMGDSESFFSAISQNSIIISVSIFSAAIIIGCYVVTREFKESTIQYLLTSIVPKTKILLSKIILLFIVIFSLEIITFGLLIIVNSFVGGLTTTILTDLLKAWLVSSSMLFLLTPAFVFVALMKREFAPSMILVLVFFMFTYPFGSKVHYLLPHLIPLQIVSYILGASTYSHNYYLAFCIMIEVFAGFLLLSIYKFGKRE